MIDHLTAEQEALLPAYKEKWTKIGLCCNRVTHEMVEQVGSGYYELILKRPPVPVILTPSPLAAWITVVVVSGIEEVLGESTNVMKHLAPMHVRGFWTSPRQQGGATASPSLRQITNSTEWELLDWLMERLSPEAAGLLSGRKSKIRSLVEAQIGNFISPYLGGHFDAAYFRYYDYINQVLGVQFDLRREYEWYLSTASVGYIYPMEAFCVVSDRPTAMHMNEERLHYDTGPALAYGDGFEIYCLSGIRVAPEVVLTPGEQLDPRLILTEQNAEVRREIVRKIGIERVCEKLNAEVVDKQTLTVRNWADKPGFLPKIIRLLLGHLKEPTILHYELLMLDIGDGTKRPYLKMRNPSIGTYVVEGVAPGITTVQRAIEFRNGSGSMPRSIT